MPSRHNVLGKVDEKKKARDPAWAKLPAIITSSTPPSNVLNRRDEPRKNDEERELGSPGARRRGRDQALRY